jgi:hypothetical protein
MAENSFIAKETEGQVPQPQAKKQKPSQASLFTQLEDKLSFENLLVPENFTKYFAKFCWVILLGFIYIFNSHVSERLSRERDKLTKFVEDLRTHYTTLHADVMLVSKESEVVQKVKELGLINNTAPRKIIVEKEK